MSNDLVQWTRNDANFAKALSFLSLLGAAGPKVVTNELNRIALIWQREIKLHMPVDHGLARASVAVSPAIVDMFAIRAAVGSNVPYVPSLEFDPSGKIAGGQVKAWKEGDSPILDWPAKRADANEKTVVSILSNGLGRNTKGRFVSRKNANAAEFMPPFRGSWQLIGPRVVERLRTQVAKLMATGRIPSGE